MVLIVCRRFVGTLKHRRATSGGQDSPRVNGFAASESPGGLPVPRSSAISGPPKSWSLTLQGGEVRSAGSGCLVGGTGLGMGESSVHERAGRPPGAARLGFDLLASKLLRPLARPGAIGRSSLVERLRRGDRCPIVSVVAPPGYGKTTLLSQWAEANGQAFAWVSVDEADNDPKVLLSYVAEALDAVEPIDERVFDALASPSSSVPGSVVPRLSSAFSAMASPVALVLDDVPMLYNSECRAAVSMLADHVPDGSQLALSGRAEP